MPYPIPQITVESFKPITKEQIPAAAAEWLGFFKENCEAGDGHWRIDHNDSDITVVAGYSHSMQSYVQLRLEAVDLLNNELAGNSQAYGYIYQPGASRTEYQAERENLLVITENTNESIGMSRGIGTRRLVIMQAAAMMIYSKSICSHSEEGRSSDADKAWDKLVAAGLATRFEHHHDDMPGSDYRFI